MLRRSLSRALVTSAGVVGLIGGASVAGAMPRPRAIESGGSFPSALALSVNRFVDDHDPGSLRSAIDQANDEGTSVVTITLPAGAYTLDACDAASTDDDTNASGDLDHTSSAALTIASAGGPVTITSSCANERVLDQRGTGELRLTGITITGGSVAPADPAVVAEGGAVRAAGAVHLIGGAFSDNTATGSSGGPVVDGGDARGGAVRAGGAVAVEGTQFARNEAIGGAGGASVDATVDAPGAGGDAAGGAISADGFITTSGASFDANTATGGRAGPASMPWTGGVDTGNWSRWPVPVQSGGIGGAARGGAIDAPFSGGSVSDSSFNGNTARGGDGSSADLPGYPHPPLTSGLPSEGDEGDAGQRGDGRSAAAEADAAAEVGSAGSAAGGALAAVGDVVLTRTTADGNASLGGDGGGVIFARRQSDIPTDPAYSWPAGKAAGGAVNVDGSLVLTDSSVVHGVARGGRRLSWSENAVYSGPLYGYLFSCGGGPSGAGEGGGVRANGSVTLTRSAIGSSSAQAGPGCGAATEGGGVVAVDGVNAVDSSIAGNGASAGGGVRTDGSVHLDHSLVANNRADRGGGVDAAGDLEVVASQVAANAAASGAGTASHGDTVVTDSSYLGNRGQGYDDDLWPGTADGGAIRAEGSVRLEGADLERNIVVGGVALAAAADICLYAFRCADGRGGASAVSAVGSIDVRLSTVAGNESKGSVAQGALVSADAITIDRSTIVDNVGLGHESWYGVPFDAIPASGTAAAATTMSVVDSTVASNVGPEALATPRLHVERSILASTGTTGGVCSPTALVTSTGFNWTDDAGCSLNGATEVHGESPLLLALADNGGPAPTRMPAGTSPVVDQIPATMCSGSIDQRGVTRPVGDACDIGAVERDLDLPPVDVAVRAVAGPTSLVAGTDLATYDITVSNQELARNTDTLDHPERPSARSVVVEGVLPAGVVMAITGDMLMHWNGDTQIIDASDGGSCKLSTVWFTCSWPDALPPSGRYQATLRTFTTTAATSPLSMHVRAAAANPDPNTANDEGWSTSPFGHIADVITTVPAPTPLTQTMSAVLAVDVRNAGPSSLRISDRDPLVTTVDLPAGVTVTKVDAQPANAELDVRCTVAGAVVCTHAGHFTAGGRTSIRISIDVIGDSTLPAHLVDVRAETVVPTPIDEVDVANNTAIAHTTMVPAADLTVAGSGKVVSDTSFVLKAAITNSGPGVASGPVAIYFDMPSVVTSMSVDDPAWECAKPEWTLQWRCATEVPIAVGARREVAITGTATSTAPGTGIWTTLAVASDSLETHPYDNGSGPVVITKQDVHPKVGLFVLTSVVAGSPFTLSFNAEFDRAFDPAGPIHVAIDAPEGVSFSPVADRSCTVGDHAIACWVGPYRDHFTVTAAVAANVPAGDLTITATLVAPVNVSFTAPATDWKQSAIVHLTAPMTSPCCAVPVLPGSPTSPDDRPFVLNEAPTTPARTGSARRDVEVVEPAERP